MLHACTLLVCAVSCVYSFVCVCALLCMCSYPGVCAYVHVCVPRVYSPRSFHRLKHSTASDHTPQNECTLPPQLLHPLLRYSRLAPDDTQDLSQHAGELASFPRHFCTERDDLVAGESATRESRKESHDGTCRPANWL